MPERIERLRDPETPAEDARAGRSRRRRACSVGSPTSATTASATSTRPRTRRSGAGSCATSRQERRPVELRHAARHRDRRRAAHGAVADPAGRRRQLVGPAPRGVERPARHDRRLRRRRAPRPHVRRALHHALPRRLPPRSSAGVARAGGAADHERSRRRSSVCATAACCARVRSPTSWSSTPRPIGSDDATLVADLPGDSARLTAGSQGIVRVLVGGVAVVEDGAATGATPGCGAALRARHRHRHRPLATVARAPRADVRSVARHGVGRGGDLEVPVSYSLILIDDPAPMVRRITLNRPRSATRSTPPCAARSSPRRARLDRDPEVRVTVIRGAGQVLLRGLRPLG